MCKVVVVVGENFARVSEIASVNGWIVIVNGTDIIVTAGFMCVHVQKAALIKAFECSSQVTKPNRPIGRSRSRTAGKCNGNARDKKFVDDSYSYSTPLNYELHLCKKMRKARAC